ncbi:MAG: CPBP family intramembrane metalloprotease [Phycisphaeraceae bacterium]|nr:CPBP family intramembrane metalloprotease [Phycisphaeraceae bacterium]
MASNPWHPRLAPFAVYLLILAIIDVARDQAAWTYPGLYVVQCGVVLWLLWRYRSLLPELTVRFDWLAVPVGVGVFVAWIGLGWWMAGEWDVRWQALLDGRFLPTFDYTALGQTPSPRATDLAQGPLDFRDPQIMGPAVGWIALSVRLLGMSIVVPLFEELFIRSLCLRSFAHYRTTAIGTVHFLMDLPLIGEWLMHTSIGERAARHQPVFGEVFLRTPLGALSIFGVVASTLVFMIHHPLRDWPGTWVCGVAYCLLVWATARKGLGPVVWAHGITNALLWIYTLGTGDWQFL